MGKTVGTSALKEGNRYTLQEWRSWHDEERWELIDGVAYNMSPAPSVRHQRVSISVFNELVQFLGRSPCAPFYAPVDVFLPGSIKDTENTVVQPDILVICDDKKIEEDGIHGAPDFIVEVLSPATGYKDLNEKRLLYERAGVKEYWLVSPDTGSVFCYALSDGRYGPVTEVQLGNEVRSTALPGLVWRFPEEPARGGQPTPEVRSSAPACKLAHGIDAGSFLTLRNVAELIVGLRNSRPVVLSVNGAAVVWIAVEHPVPAFHSRIMVAPQRCVERVTKLGKHPFVSLCPSHIADAVGAVRCRIQLFLGPAAEAEPVVVAYARVVALLQQQLLRRRIIHIHD